MFFFWWYVSFFGTSNSSLMLSFSKFLECAEDFFKTLVILSSILLPIKSLVVSAVFWINLFEASFYCIHCRFLALSRSFWPYLLLKFLPMFFAKDKIHILLHIFYLWVQLNISFLYSGIALDKIAFSRYFI